MTLTSNLLRLVRDYLALSGGELLSKVAGFLAFAYLARALGVAAYGAVELAVALAMVFGLVVDFGLGPIGAREVARQPQRAAALAGQITRLRLYLALGAVAAMGLTVQLLDLSPAGRQLTFLFALSLLAAPWTLNWLLQGLDRVARVALATSLRMGCFLAGVLLLVRGPDDLWRVGVVEIAAMVAMALYYVAQTRPYLRASRSQDEPRGLRRLGWEALPLALSQLLWALNHYLPTLLVAVLVSQREVAFFGGAHRIIISLNAFIWLYFFNLYPSLARATDQQARSVGDFEALSRISFRLTAWLGILGGLLGTLFATPVCRLAYGADFEMAALPFAVLVWVLPLHLLSGHARFALIAAGHQRQELIAQAVGVALTLGLGIVAIERGGAMGAAVTMVASAFLVWLVAHAFASRRVGRLPLFGPLLRPGAAALAAIALMSVLPAGGWGLAGACSFYGLAGLLGEPLLRQRLGLWLWRDARAQGREE